MSTVEQIIISIRRQILKCAAAVAVLATCAGCAPSPNSSSAAYQATCEGPPLVTPERRDLAAFDGYAIDKRFDCITKESVAAIKREKEKWLATRIEDGIALRKDDFAETALQEAENYAATVAGSVIDASSPTDAPASEDGANDRRWYIDVWQLRREIVPVEALETSDDTYTCYPEGDGSETFEQIAAQQKESARCEQRTHEEYKRYSDARAALNARWLPLINEAISKGDRVAEVIMRQCDTTPVLDRANFESTCDENEARRAIALKRLTAIAFVPAIPFQPIPSPGASRFNGSTESQNAAREVYQNLALERMKSGALGGFNFHSINVGGGNVAYNQSQIELYRRCNFIQKTLSEARLAFSLATMADFSSGYISVSQQALSQLRLNRQPAKGPLYSAAAFFGNDSSCGGTPFFVHRYGIHSQFPDSDSPTSPAHVDRMDRHQLLISIYANVSRYLKEDSRWAVFLIKRTNDHDWEPVQPATRITEATSK